MTMPLTNEQITALLSEPSRQDFFEFINDMKRRKSWKSREFASELKKNFPDVDEGPLHNGQHLEMSGNHDPTWLVSGNEKII